MLAENFTKGDTFYDSQRIAFAILELFSREDFCCTARALPSSTFSRGRNENPTGACIRSAERAIEDHTVSDKFSTTAAEYCCRVLYE